MRTRTKRKDARERDDLIVDFIKESGPDGVAPSDIATLFDLNDKNRMRIMHYLIQDNPQIVRKGSTNNTRYIWREEPAEIEKPELRKPQIRNSQMREIHSAFLKNRYEKTNKNDEGYIDMTATQAIRNVEPDKKSDINTQNLLIPNPGEVWTSKESNGDISFVYILSYCSYNEKAQIVRVYDVKSSMCPDNPLHDVRVKLGVNTYVGDLTEFSNKKRKYLIKRIGVRVDEQLMRVRKELCGILELKPIWNDIKRVEEEPVEVPDTKNADIPDGYISKDEAEFSLLTKELEIWKSVAMKLLDSRN